MEAARNFLATHVDPAGERSRRFPVGRELGGGRLGVLGGVLEWRHREAAQVVVGASGVGGCQLLRIPGRAQTWSHGWARGDVVVGRTGRTRLDTWVRLGVVAVVGYWDFGGTLELVVQELASQPVGSAGGRARGVGVAKMSKESDVGT